MESSGDGKAVSFYQQAFRAIDACLGKEAGCCSSGTAGPRRRTSSAISDVVLLPSFVEPISFIHPDLVADDGIKENHGVAWRLLEQAWQSLCNQPAEIPSPELHAEVLCERARRLTDSEAVRVPWRESNPSAAACGMNVQSDTELIVMRNGQICSLPPEESDNLPPVVEPPPATPLVTPAGPG